MKILTLNTHSLEVPGYEKKLMLFVEMIIKERPEIFALQEVNQLLNSSPVEPGDNYVQAQGYTGEIREDNHAYRISELLKQSGLNYQWTWIGAKISYEKYDEGMAIFSLTPIEEIAQFYISRDHSFYNWKTRKALGIKTGATSEWYFSVHMGWWDDEEEPFAVQWDNLQAELKAHTLCSDKIWLLGDFNSPADGKNEGYHYMKQNHWLDTYDLAEEKDCGITVENKIDGWKERSEVNSEGGIRIDYIWCNYPAKIKSTEVVFNGKRYPVVSDHYGVMVEVDSLAGCGMNKLMKK